MVTVACPECRTVVKGSSEDELSLALQEHMVETHKLKNVCDLEQVRSKKACKPSTSEELASEDFTERIETEAHSKKGLRHGGEDVTESVRCPVCGETILGGAEEDLSFYLESHYRKMHKWKEEWRA
jgi:predicted small metal-binding protein